MIIITDSTLLKEMINDALTPEFVTELVMGKLILMKNKITGFLPKWF
jgi:hypothetical protein